MHKRSRLGPVYIYIYIVKRNNEKSSYSYTIFFDISLFFTEIVRDHTFMTSTRKGGEVVLKFVTCLWFVLFLNNNPIVHFCGWWGREGGVKKLVIFCGHHKWMTPQREYHTAKWYPEDWYAKQTYFSTVKNICKNKWQL